MRWIEKNVGENFSAGLTRDFGVNYVLENYPNYEMILFTDGDCVPSERVIEKQPTEPKKAVETKKEEDPW